MWTTTTRTTTTTALLSLLLVSLLPGRASALYASDGTLQCQPEEYFPRVSTWEETVSRPSDKQVCVNNVAYTWTESYGYKWDFSFVDVEEQEDGTNKTIPAGVPVSIRVQPDHESTCEVRVGAGENRQTCQSCRFAGLHDHPDRNVDVKIGVFEADCTNLPGGRKIEMSEATYPFFYPVYFDEYQNQGGGNSNLPTSAPTLYASDDTLGCQREDFFPRVSTYYSRDNVAHHSEKQVCVNYVGYTWTESYGYKWDFSFVDVEEQEDGTNKTIPAGVPVSIRVQPDRESTCEVRVGAGENRQTCQSCHFAGLHDHPDRNVDVKIGVFEADCTNLPGGRKIEMSEPTYPFFYPVYFDEYQNQGGAGDSNLPTLAPTGSPSTEQTYVLIPRIPDPPTANPSNAPSLAPTKEADDKQLPKEGSGPKKADDKQLPKEGSSSGDPHFKTFDYHGECDLVLVDHPEFNNGQGLKVHIRTTRVKYFSFIESVAVQIGSDVLEFNNDVEKFSINGKPVEANRKHHKTRLAGFLVRRDPKAISIRLADGNGLHQKTGAAKIDLIQRKNGFPAVVVNGGSSDLFKGSLGLLGEWETGRTLGRDGLTEIPVSKYEATEFALEWQVRDTEPKLFQESRFPQFPTVCTPPAKMPNENRLGASRIKKEAEEACAHWEEDIEDCIFDVIATKDILTASEGQIVSIE